MSDRSRFFSLVNGREVFDNGIIKRWRCPECKWWCEWDNEKCCGCGALRDHKGHSPERAWGNVMSFLNHLSVRRSRNC
jgi:hypothetical protein